MFTERISVRWGLRLLAPLIAVGVGSIVYWQYTESRGMGDLRPYVIVQFCPLLAILLMLFLLPPRYDRSGDIPIVLGLYVLAKILELVDAPIFSLGHIVNGHTLKHLAAGLATYCVLRMLELRSPQLATGDAAPDVLD